MSERISINKWRFWLLIAVLLLYIGITGISISQTDLPFFTGSNTYLPMVVLVTLYFVSLGLTSDIFGCRIGLVLAAVLGWQLLSRRQLIPISRNT